MPRITISIPADLKDRLRDPRIRKSVNISRICQKALHREVLRLLELPVDLLRMEDLISRMKQEREHTVDHWFWEGGQLAKDWVEHEAPYAFVRQLGKEPLSQRIELLKKNPPGILSQSIARLQTQQDFSESSFFEGFAHMAGLLWAVVEKNL